MKILFATLGAAGAFFACSAAALALSANGWTTPRAYSGACPATMTLTGLIAGGSRGATVQYLFYYLEPSTNKVIGLPMQTGVLDATGALTPSATVSIDGAHAGTSWVRLSAQSGGASTNSTNTPFTVSCTSSSTPTPDPEGGTLATAPPHGPVPTPPPSNYITRMTHRMPRAISAPAIRLTNNPSDCTKHVGDVITGAFAPLTCKTAMDQGNVVLVWDWTPIAACPPERICPAIDGYHVYAMQETKSMAPMGGASGPALVDTQTTDITLSTPRSGSCFAVTAFSGKDESPLSNIVCAAERGPVSSQTVTLVPPANHVRSVLKNHFRNTGSLTGKDETNVYPRPGQILAGFYYSTSSQATGDTSDDIVWRGGFWFDLSSLNGKTITNATLHLLAQSTLLGMPQQPNATASCARYIGTGTEDWWNEGPTGWLDSDFFATLGRDGPNIDVDVTYQLRQWTRGTPNYGFVLKGAEENLDAFTENSCESHYSASLEVKYHE